MVALSTFRLPSVGMRKERLIVVVAWVAARSFLLCPGKDPCMCEVAYLDYQ
jgi:hypothetical protein